MAESFYQKTHSIFKAINTDTVLIFFSMGKDSIVLLDLAMKYFKKVIPVYMYFVKDLEHIERKIKQFESFYNIKIEQVPHWTLSYYYESGYFRFDSNKAEKTEIVKIIDIENYLKQKFNCDWILNGMRKSDSIFRALMFKTYKLGAICEVSKRAHPLVDWKTKDISFYIKYHKLPKPIFYGDFKVSGLDINKRTLQIVKENYYEDYLKILKEFPFAETQLIRDDFYGK